MSFRRWRVTITPFLYRQRAAFLCSHVLSRFAVWCSVDQAFRLNTVLRFFYRLITWNLILFSGSVITSRILFDLFPRAALPESFPGFSTVSEAHFRIAFLEACTRSAQHNQSASQVPLWSSSADHISKVSGRSHADRHRYSPVHRKRLLSLRHPW